MKKMEVGLIGLGVMGSSLCLNMASKGYSVCVYNREREMTEAFLEKRANGKDIHGVYSLKELVNALTQPRKIFMMITAGVPVGQVCSELCDLLEPGDILIDGGNSNYEDTAKRQSQMAKKHILYIGSGISGGEYGALHGPSMMPGGDHRAWEQVRSIFEAISAKAIDGAPCCSWIGPQGAGHYVKMVHNGIEYSDMQLICEVYAILRDLLCLAPEQISKVFERWSSGPLDSYLISITAAIFRVKDTEGDGYLVDHILDCAGQKGTGKWAVATALDAGVPLTLIGESVFSRYLSDMKAERVAAAARSRKKNPAQIDRDGLIDQLEQALYAGKIISYAQGFALMKAKSDSSGWKLKLDEIALIWREGCIIRSQFLERVHDAYSKNPGLCSLMTDDYFADSLGKADDALRQVVCTAVSQGVAVPALSAAVAYYDGYHCAKLPANLLQAQRDYFGAHTFLRDDKPASQSFHHDWEKEATAK